MEEAADEDDRRGRRRHGWSRVLLVHLPPTLTKMVGMRSADGAKDDGHQRAPRTEDGPGVSPRSLDASPASRMCSRRWGRNDGNDPTVILTTNPAGATAADENRFRTLLSSPRRRWIRAGPRRRWIREGPGEGRPPPMDPGGGRPSSPDSSGGQPRRDRRRIHPRARATAAAARRRRPPLSSRRRCHPQTAAVPPRFADPKKEGLEIMIQLLQAIYIKYVLQ